jgi:CBS domain-containing protein
MFTLASIFVNHGFRHLPVTDDHILLGIVSRRDVLRALNEYYNQVVHDSIRQHSPPDLTKLVNHRFLVSD